MNSQVVWDAPSSSAPRHSDALRRWALVVASDPANEPVYATVLAQMDVDCVCISSVMQLSPALVRAHCIGIFLDRAAGRSQLEVAARIRNTTGLDLAPIVLVTSAPVDDVNQVQGLNLPGAVDYLAAPLDRNLLQAKVAFLLELHQRQVEIEELRCHRAIFEHPTLMMVVIQAVRTQEGHVIDWIYQDANANALRVLKQTRETLLGRRLSEVLPDRAERLIALCAQILTSQEPLHYEARFDSQDFLTSLFPAGADSLVSSGIDVTARNHAEHEVRRLLDEQRAEKEWLFAVLNGISEEVYFTDPQGHYTYANPAALREFGHASLAGVCVVSTVANLVVLRPDGTPRPAEEAPPLRALSGEIVKNEGQIVRNPHTGEYRHREVSSTPVRNAAGDIIGSVSVARDVTESRLTEVRLRAAAGQARLAEAASRATLAAELAAMQRLHDISTTSMVVSDQQVLFEQILDATIALHGAQSGSVQLLDPQTQTLFMAAHRGMDQETLERFAAVDAACKTTCGVALARRARVIVEDVQADPDRIVDPEVARRMGLGAVQSTPLFTSDGSILGMLSTQFGSPRGFSQDELRITDLYARQAGIAIERRRVADALIAARESADLANKAKSHFVRAASHDLRQAVQTLALVNGTLHNSAMDATARSALRQQTEAIETMTHLLDALLNISKLESGATAPQVSDFAVGDLFEKLRVEFSALAESKGLELKIDAPSAKAIHSDPTLVGEVLRNFISNAIKFTSRGTVTLRASPAESTMRLEVIDTGVGIAHEELPLIFGEFYQVGVSATLNRQGYGLGLGIAQRIATLLQADISVDSEVGRGSTFSLAVPMSERDIEVHAARNAERRVRKNETSATLLLVEDDTAVRSSMELFLRSCGYRLVSAASLDQTRALLARSPRPDVLLTDFHLPGDKTGADVIRCVRAALGENFPAILISGDTSAEIEGLSHDAGVRFASKPLDPDSLVALVQELLMQSAASLKAG